MVNDIVGVQVGLEMLAVKPRGIGWHRIAPDINHHANAGSRQDTDEAIDIKLAVTKCINYGKISHFDSISKANIIPQTGYTYMHARESQFTYIRSGWRS